MSRLVIVANRVPNPSERGATAGGLAVALKDAMTGREAMWFGWSGQTAEATATEPTEQVHGRLTYATLDLGREDYRRYYLGFANATLWPTLHYRLGLAQFSRADYASYRAVNAGFAAALAPLLRPDDLVWSHDFHLFPFGAELRRLGCTQRQGFFLHVPFPPFGLFCALPKAEELLADLAAYDVIGVQTEDDAANLRAALVAVGQAEAAERVAAFPVGIDAEGFRRLAERAQTRKDTQRFHQSLLGRSLVIGVDRLDYTKGLPQRLAGYGQLLARFKAHHGKTTYLQVTPVSRGDVAQYRSLRRELDEWVGRINGQHAEPDWAPLRYMTRAVARPTLAGFMRIARVGLVTPLRDGMNLVAKEYRRRPGPGRSRGAGAVPLRRRGAATARRAAGQSARPGCHRRKPGCRAEHAEGERVARWESMRPEVWGAGAKAWSRDFMAAMAGLPDPCRGN